MQSDILDLKDELKNSDNIREVLEKYGLVVENGVLKAKERKHAKQMADYWDTQQHLRKIMLNSLYGATLNNKFMFHDIRFGQSVTMTGRCVNRLMNTVINYHLTGEFNSDPEHWRNIVYGDSVTGDTVITLRTGGEVKEMSFEELWNMFGSHTRIDVDGKEFIDMRPYDVEILGYDPDTQKKVFWKLDMLIRHSTNKEMYEVEHNDKKVTVTGDHSLVVETVDGDIVEKRPTELEPTDRIPGDEQA